MQTYTSHKKVEAAKIVGVSLLQATGGAIFALDDGGSETVNHDFMVRLNGREPLGGYFVRYDDGFTSWSPADAFDAGYTKGEPAQGLPVAGYKPTQPGWAIEAVNGLKHAEERAHRLLDDLVAKGEAVDQRAVALARTGLQQAFMWAARGVFQPSRVQLPEDNAPLFPSDAKGG